MIRNSRESQSKWLEEFSGRLGPQGSCPEARTAWRHLIKDGCTVPNLLSFVYGSSKGGQKVDPKRTKELEMVRKGLTGISRSITTAANKLEKLGSTQLYHLFPGKTVSQVLGEADCDFILEPITFEATEASGAELPTIHAKGRVIGPWFDALPQLLRQQAASVNWLNLQLLQFGARGKFQRVMLVHFVAYVEAVTKRRADRSELSAILSAASDDVVDPREIGTRLARFRKDYPELMEQIHGWVSSYVAMCPDGNPSYMKYLRQKS